MLCLAVITRYSRLGLEVGEVVAVQGWHPTPIRVLGTNERPLPPNFGAILGGIADGALVPLTAVQAARCLARHHPLRLVA